MRKPFIKKIGLYSEAAVAATFSIPYTITDLVDQIRYAINWANGVAEDFDVSLEVTFDDPSNPTVTPTWYTLPLTAVPTLTGGSGNHIVDVELLIGKAMRLTFTRNAGQADIDVSIFGTSKGA